MIKNKKSKTFETGRKPHGFWKKWENVELELKKVATRIGHFPTQTELARNGYMGMVDAIGNYYGGLNRVRDKLGYESKTVEHGTWKDLDYTLNQAREKAKKENHELANYAIKTIMNSFWGVLASPNCRYFDLKMANAITSFARWATQQTAKKIESGVLDKKLVYKKSIRKSLEEYTKTTPPHVKAARKLPKLESNIIEYYITTGGPEPVQQLKHKIDYQHYIEKQIQPIAEQILILLSKHFVIN